MQTKQRAIVAERIIMTHRIGVAIHHGKIIPITNIHVYIKVSESVSSEIGVMHGKVIGLAGAPL